MKYCLLSECAFLFCLFTGPRWCGHWARVDKPCWWQLAWLALERFAYLVAMVSALPGVHAAGRVKQAVVNAKVQIKFVTVKRFDVVACNEHISPSN